MPDKKISLLHTPRCEKGGNSYVSQNALTKTSRNPCINHATASSVAVSNLIQHNGSLFLPRNDEHPRVHFCTPLITIPYAPLRSKGFSFIAACAYIAISSKNWYFMVLLKSYIIIIHSKNSWIPAMVWTGFLIVKRLSMVPDQ